jgi:hypothetical protein
MPVEVAIAPPIVEVPAEPKVAERVASTAPAAAQDEQTVRPRLHAISPLPKPKPKAAARKRPAKVKVSKAAKPRPRRAEAKPPAAGFSANSGFGFPAPNRNDPWATGKPFAQ